MAVDPASAKLSFLVVGGRGDVLDGLSAVFFPRGVGVGLGVKLGERMGEGESEQEIRMPPPASIRRRGHRRRRDTWRRMVVLLQAGEGGVSP